MTTEFLGTATYSPDDNKLRFYPFSRLDAADYAPIKEAGFKWAPKQELFVAPMWRPSGEDLLLEWCGEVGDEDTSLVERAEERAERFEGYQEKRASEAERAHEVVSQICEHIPLGQPILVGHHSERRARKDAERIENGMRRPSNCGKPRPIGSNAQPAPCVMRSTRSCRPFAPAVSRRSRQICGERNEKRPRLQSPLRFSMTRSRSLSRAKTVARSSALCC